MQRGGFEPPKALSHKILSLARLTTSLPLHMFSNYYTYKKLYKPLCDYNGEDDHNSQETPDPFPNSEVKLAML